MKMLRKNWLYIYTDGSCLQKPRRGGIGIRYVYLDESENEHRIDGNVLGYSGATNNQMELMAVIEGLKGIKDQDIPVKYSNIEVRTDSKYVVDNKNRAIYIWSKKGWLNQHGKPVENASLWKALIKVLQSTHRNVDIIWIKGHAKDPDNEAVDHLAKDSAKSLLKSPIYTVKLRRKTSKTKTVLGSIEMKGQRVSIHIINEEFLHPQKLSKYRYEVISKGSKYIGNVDIAYSDLHHLKAGHKYLVTFNKDNRNPRILKVINEIT